MFYDEKERDSQKKLSFIEYDLLSKCLNEGSDGPLMKRLLADSRNMSKIVKFCDSSESFKKQCVSRTHDHRWLALWKTVLHLLADKLERKNFKTRYQSNISPFKLAMGAHFTYLAVTNEGFNRATPSPYVEMLLEKALKHQSIHAAQLLNDFLYREMADQNKKDSQTADNQLNMIDRIIGNCLKLLPEQGAYAYIMLSDAYLAKTELAMKAGMYIEAMEARKNAEKCYESAISINETASEVSIENASLGGGFEYSNRKHLPSFVEYRDDMKKRLNPKTLSDMSKLDSSEQASTEYSEKTSQQLDDEDPSIDVTDSSFSRKSIL